MHEEIYLKFSKIDIDIPRGRYSSMDPALYTKLNPFIFAH